MGQHKHNPTALAAARGEIKPKRKATPNRVWSIDALKAEFWPKLRYEKPVKRSGSTRTTRRNRALRSEAAAVARRSHLFPPQKGQRRPQFSSAVAGQWSVDAAA